MKNKIEPLYSTLKNFYKKSDDELRYIKYNQKIINDAFYKNLFLTELKNIFKNNLEIKTIDVFFNNYNMYFDEKNDIELNHLLFVNGHNIKQTKCDYIDQVSYQKIDDNKFMLINNTVDLFIDLFLSSINNEDEYEDNPFIVYGDEDDIIYRLSINSNDLKLFLLKHENF